MSRPSSQTANPSKRERFCCFPLGSRAPSSTARSPSSLAAHVSFAIPLSTSPSTVHLPMITAAPSSSLQLVSNSSNLSLLEEALKLLSDDDRTIIQNHTLPTAGEIDSALVQTIAAAKVMQQRCIEKRWALEFAGRTVTLKDKADKVIGWLNRFKSVGDIVVNVDPIHAGLPWAGICFLLEAAVSEANQMNSLLVGCETVLYIANRLKAYADFLQGLPTTLTRTNFKTSLTKLYAHIFGFLAKAIKIYQASTFERSFKAFWSIDEIQEFEKSCDQLGREVEIEASNCDRTLSAQDRVRTEELQINLSKILEDLKGFRTIQDSLDRIEINHYLDKMPYAKGATFDAYGQTRTTCHHETRVDLLHRIKTWARDPLSKHIFWLNGMAGIGKSTISQTFAEWLSKQDNVNLGASFFFKRNEGDRGSAFRFFPTIVKQLVGRLPGLDVFIADAIKSDPFIFDKSLSEQFTKLLNEPLKKVNITNSSHLTLILVVDALDECETKNQIGTSDIEVILKLWPQLSQPRTVRLKLFLTSRPDLPTRLGFRYMSVNDYQDMVLHDEKEVPLATIQHDIMVFLADEFSKIRKHYNTALCSKTPLEDTWPGQNILQDLVDMAIPLFIIAATVCRYVSDVKQPPRRKLERILDFQKQNQLGQLKQMEQTYLPVLTQHVGTFSETYDENEYYEQFRRIVGSIVTLAEPLSITSLESLLGMDQDVIERHLDDLQSVLHVPKDNIMPVRTLHLSFREFLLSDKLQDRPFGVNGPATHRMLLNKCLELLSQPDGLRENICGLTYPGQPRGEVSSTIVNQRLSPALQYACKYWVYHAQHSQTQIRDDDEVHKFITKYFLNWLEALALIDRISKAVEQVHILQSLTLLDASHNLSMFLEDARRTILAYRNITDLAPLQIYSSAIIFTPQKSTIRNIYQVPRWIDTCPITPSSWDTELQTLEGHSDWVTSVAFSHDSKLLASASEDLTVKIWDASTGSLQQTLEGHSNRVTSVAFSHDSKLLASASDDWTVNIWDASTGSLQQTLEGHSGQTVKIWDASTGSLQQTLEGHSDQVTSVAFSHDSKLLASASEDETVKIWDASTGSLQQTLEGHSDWVTSVAFSHDSKLLASASIDETVKIWDASTGSLQQTLEGHSDRVISVAFSHDSKLLASASEDETVKIWDASTGSLQQTLKGHSGQVTSVSFSHDSKLLASASIDETVKIWDASTGSLQQTLEGHGDSVTSVSFSHDSKLLASASRYNTVKIWDVSTGSLQQTLKDHSSGANSVAALGFNTSNSDLVTDLDRIRVDIARSSNLSSSSQEGSNNSNFERLGIRGSWITWNGQNLLWIPPSFRANCHRISPSMSLVATGCLSGKVYFIEFSLAILTSYLR
ncbi:hypothetical protein BP6252_11501 [Coleophoma cylindrospora]|uniref:NACHT domain-containing protein n=1 Tax=Coleophoma cylindrospora TaxID=1849047 RepID=A0A3D8QK22_9HELO|nr:hypothetical protein BP6252_11501 [Coleophoma cylindrospora]